MVSNRKPDIVCIGAQKSGTSWLHETLSIRPDVWVPPFKELHFFDHKFVKECRQWAPWHVKKGVKQARERYQWSQVTDPKDPYLEYLDRLVEKPFLNGSWYKYVFSRAGAQQKCLDVTPEYSCIPDDGVDFFKRFLPGVKIIYIIRHPMDRLKSQLRMNAFRRKSLPSSRAEWFELLESKALRTRGDYLGIVPRWDRRFSDNQLLYLPFGQIAGDPMGFLRMVEEHCGLEPGEYKNAHRKVHQTQRLEFPDFVLRHLEAMSAPQSEFIQERFGKNFYLSTV
ncbi:sulfotransferase [Pseudophaeobacter sp. TrK17]|jgi:hypothetical protein|uniref:sulfotransferase family protein n=1 Tax=Pseudophaeobacter sp. TrK17 TaxID=2815167 RepID=UPI0035CFA278